MGSSEKRKLVPKGTTPKKAEKLRKKLGESGSSSPRSPLRTTTGFGGKRLFSSPSGKVLPTKRLKTSSSIFSRRNLGCFCVKC